MTVCFSAVPVKLMLKCSHYGAVRSKLNVTIFRDSTCSQFDGAVHREKLLSARLQTNFRLTLITQVGNPDSLTVRVKSGLQSVEIVKRCQAECLSCLCCDHDMMMLK